MKIIVKIDKYGELENTETTSFLPLNTSVCLWEDKYIMRKISKSQRIL